MQPQRPRNPRLTPIRLHAAIVETLWANVSAARSSTCATCSGCRLARPTSSRCRSKRVYVRERLKGFGLATMIEIAQTIIAEYDDTPLLDELLRPSGVRGVDGELKNLIFAAHGPKPRIVLADAINNVIEIVEHADKCLVYDRPLDGSGLSWGDAGGLVVGDLARRRRRAGARLVPRGCGLARQPAGEGLFNAYCARYGSPTRTSCPP